MSATSNDKQNAEIGAVIGWGTIIGPSIVLIAFSPINLDYFGLPKLTALYLVTLFLIYFQIRRWIAAGRVEIPFETIHVLSIIVILITTASIIASANPLESVFGVFNRYESFIALLCNTVILWLSFQTAQAKDFKYRFELIFILTFAIITIYGLLELLGHSVLKSPFIAEGGRASSTLGNPIFFGSFLSMALPILLAKILFPPYKSKRLWDNPAVILVLISLGIAMLFSAFSRGAWVGSIVGFLVVLYLKNKVKNRVKNKGKVRDRKNLFVPAKSWIVIILICLALGIFLALGLARLDILHIFDKAGSTLSFDTRVEIWKSALPLISKRPLFGYGLDQTKDWLNLYITLRLARLGNTIHDRAHNIFIQFALNGGVFLLLIQVWMFVYAILKGARSARDSGDYILVGFVGALAGYLVQGMTGIATNELSVFSWLILGATIGAASRKNLRITSLPIVGGSLPKWFATLILIPLILAVVFPIFAEARYYTLANKASATLSEPALEQAYKANEFCILQPYYRKHFAQVCLSYAYNKQDAKFAKAAIIPLSSELRYYRNDHDLLEAIGESYLASAMFSKDKRDLSLAGKYLGHAHDKAPKLLETDISLFEFYMQDGDYRKAAKCAQEMRTISNSDPRSRVAEAITYKLKGGNEKADALFKEIDKSDPKIKALKDRLLEDIKKSP